MKQKSKNTAGRNSRRYLPTIFLTVGMVALASSMLTYLSFGKDHLPAENNDKTTA